MAALSARVVSSSGGSRNVEVEECGSCIVLCFAVHIRSVPAWGLVYCQKYLLNAQGQILARASLGLPTSMSLFKDRNKARLGPVTCLTNTSAKHKYLTMFSLHQGSALFWILTYFFLFLFLWCLLSCCCNHAAKTSVRSAGGWKPLSQTRHSLPLCFSAVVYAKAGGEEQPGL